MSETTPKDVKTNTQWIGWKSKDGIVSITFSLQNMERGNWILDEVKQYLRDLVQINRLKKQSEEQSTKAKLEGRDNMGRGLKSNPDFLKGKMK